MLEPSVRIGGGVIGAIASPPASAARRASSLPSGRERSVENGHGASQFHVDDE